MSVTQRGKRRDKTQENLWVHTLGPLNVPIQSEAVIEISESDFDTETSKKASDWIGMLKGPTCVSRGSLVFCLALIYD